jgi:hypothetical protein
MFSSAKTIGLSPKTIYLKNQAATYNVSIPDFARLGGRMNKFYE